MKTIFFLRGSWRKKDKRASTPVTSTPDPEPVHFDAPSSPVSKNKNRFPSGDSDDTSHSSQGSSEQAERQNLEPHRTRLRLKGNHGALFNTTHGPPQNSFHGPPHFNRPGRTARPSTAPSRPPRPPSLDLYSHPRPMSANPRSPNRVRFAPAPQIRPPDSPSRHSFRHVGQTKACIVDLPNDGQTAFEPERTAYLQVSQHAESPFYAVAERHNRMASKYIYVEEDSSGASIITNTCPPSPLYAPQDPHRTVCAVLDLSDLPSPRSLYHVTGSNPHLPIVKTKPLPKISKYDMESGFSLAPFPSPPPLAIRKRPKPLVLFTTPTLARLPPSPAIPPSPGCPPSPAFSSADSTPPMTPVSPRPLQLSPSNMTTRKPAGRFLSGVPPPTFSPPNTPLPTLPTYSSATLGIPPNQQLRSAHSTADFRSQPLHPSGGHRATLSAPSSGSHCSAESNRRRRTQSRPDFPAASSQLVNIFVSDSQSISLIHVQHPKERMPKPHIDSHIQWGYAL